MCVMEPLPVRRYAAPCKACHLYRGMTTVGDMTEAAAPVAHGVPQWTLGDRLRKARRHVGATQAAFAEQLGESAKTYSNWEADRHPPASVVVVAQRVEQVTGVPAAWLLGLGGDPSPDRPGPFSPTGGPATERGSTHR